VTIRVLYVMFVRLTGWIALLARSATSKDAELLVLRREGTALRRQNPRPRLDWANRMVIVALAPTLPQAAADESADDAGRDVVQEPVIDSADEGS